MKLTTTDHKLAAGFAVAARKKALEITRPCHVRMLGDTRIAQNDEDGEPAHQPERTEEAGFRRYPLPPFPGSGRSGIVSARTVLIDHRACGGSGCRKCEGAGTAMTETQRPDGDMPASEDAFDARRESCPCYEGFSINVGVAQCTHADHPDDGEWCDVDSCPRVVDRVSQEGGVA